MLDRDIQSQVDLIEQTFGIKVIYHDFNTSTTITSTADRLDGTRTIREIAREIQQDWGTPFFGAVPYLEAMLTINSIEDDYYSDSARDVVRYFLSNATTWRGETARRVKKELKEMLND